jgi:GT2 family glycosyltransferase
MYKVCAVIVTYNRLNLLKECVNALNSQTYPVHSIIIVDNNSNDGTYNYCEKLKKINSERIVCIHLKKNIGGAGGFKIGIKEASLSKADFVWVMDDDTIPTKDALKELINSAIFLNGKENFSFLASQVRGISKSTMNLPIIETAPKSNGYPAWNEYLDNGLVGISCATFVSILVKTNAVLKVGLPFDFYFIWGDDTEYTKRLTTFYGKAFLVGKSCVIHKRKNEYTISLEKENNSQRIKNYFFYYRNGLLNSFKYEKFANLFKLLVRYCLESFKFLIKFEFRKFFIVQKGILCFIFNSKLKRKVKK